MGKLPYELVGISLYLSAFHHKLSRLISPGGLIQVNLIGFLIVKTKE